MMTPNQPFQISSVAVLALAIFAGGCGGDDEPEQVDPLGCEAPESTVVVNPESSPQATDSDSRNLGPVVPTERGYFAIRPVDDSERDAFVYESSSGGFEYTGFLDYTGPLLGAVEDDYVLYTFNSENPRDGEQQGRLQIIDLAVSGEPVVAAELDLEMNGKRCYSSRRLGRAAVTKTGDQLFFTCEESLATVDVSDPCAPSLTSFETLSDIASDTPIEHQNVVSEEIDSETTRLYVATRLRESNQFRVGIYDYGETLEPRGSVVLPMGTRQFYDIELRDGMLYLVHSQLNIIDVSDPTAPQIVSTTSLEGQSGGMDFLDGKLWMTLIVPGDQTARRVLRWDVSTPSAPVQEESWDVGAQFTSVWDLQARNGQIYVTGVTRGGSGIQQVDLN